MKALARAIHGIGARSFLRLRLRAEEGSIPTLLFAGQVPAAGSKSSGGKVKLRILAESYPEHGFAGNILYLISSALPKEAIGWASLASAKGITVILNQNGVAFPAWAEAGELERVNKRNRKLLELADVVVYQSEFCRNACEHWVGAHKPNAKIVYNPVDIRRFRRVRAPVKGNILLLGSHAQPERVLLAIKALGAAVLAGNDWSMVVAGPLHWAGAEREVAALAAEMGVASRVKFHGRYSTEEQIDFLNDASALLHLQDKDASPTVPLEAMACEVPVVGIRSGGMPELVLEEAGVLLPVEQGWDQYFYPSVAQVCDGLGKALAHREEMGRAGRRIVEAKFSSETFLSAHAEIFQAVLMGRKK